LDSAAIPPAALALSQKQGIEWFDAICDVLKRSNRPTVHSMRKLLGTLAPENRYDQTWRDIVPFDRRFGDVGIRPGLPEDGPDAPLDGLSFARGFSLRVGDIARRFADYTCTFNAYDDGTQISFYPVPPDYEFTAVDVWTSRDDLPWLAKKAAVDVVVDNVRFGFGDVRFRLRDGFHMRRRA
jgi:hypothetical protein